jgi:hypothetical protein
MKAQLFLCLGLTVLRISVAAQSGYTPPPASATAVSGIPFATAQSLDQELHDRFVQCDQHNV